MPFDDDLQRQLLARLQADFGLQAKGGKWLRGGKCPKCGKKELFCAAEAPKVLVCGRKDKCAHEEAVKDRYPDLFENWSQRTKDDPSPTAAADGYLRNVRGFDLLQIRGAFAQEYYFDKKLNIGSATVRFPLPGGSWWERLIDQPSRFGKKANFAPGTSYAGHVWQPPGTTMADYAAAEEIWLVEGIFDTIALEQGDFRAARDPDHPVHKARVGEDGEEIAAAPVEQLRGASLMSCYNWPEHFLRELRLAIAAGPTPTKSPLLVFALDLGAAGTEYTRKFVKRARAEGWRTAAAQVRFEDEAGHKLDWNDLFLRDRLGHEARRQFRWAGDVLVAADEREKAYLIWREKKWGSFPLTFEARTYWASISEDAIAARIDEFSEDPDVSALNYAVKYDRAARETIKVSMIANCTFRALYYERNEVTDKSAYWLRIDRPGNWPMVKASFPGTSLASAGDFKKRLLSVVSGAIWTGDQYQLDRMTQRQLPVRDVTGIEFTGYCRQHKTYVFGDLAVHEGRFYRLNEDGYFDIGKAAIKLRSSERVLDAIAYDPDRLDQSWLPDFWTAWGTKGMVLLAFMGVGALLAEQIRAAHKSLGFLEVTGIPGSGKSTATEFMWKLLGRDSYEGFDPAKATQAGVARELAKVANLPVVFIEGDRKEDVPHAKRFDWEETKTLYNGRATRTRGVKSDGLETYSPPFRGAFMIVQNEPVVASPAVLERIMAVNFTKDGWTHATKTAARKLEAWPIEQLSGYLIHAARREEALLARVLEEFAKAEHRLMLEEDVRNQRLAKTHAQLMAMVAALPIVLPTLPAKCIEETIDFVREMCIARHAMVATDHPHVERFWEVFEGLEASSSPDHPINHSRDPVHVIAVNLIEFEERCASRRLELPRQAELRKALKTSKRNKFVKAGPVNSITNKTVHCWVFERGGSPYSGGFL
ncbi:MAG: hypothetical protein A4S12_06935 [Proteobacteria bacterium SG_bin5]|nr:bifunctional DNA primase/helicase [Sphingomonas sp.]OQW42068.1 MAG: hypothetical protein A4S12_06935 [Proteobacteria bacterium SG_bin5]